jgi:hypothetical protein
MNRPHKFFALVTTALVFAALSSISAQTQTYRLKDLGVPAGRQLIHPAAVNVQGWVALVHRARRG